MRLLYTSSNQSDIKKLGAFLTSQGIDHQVDMLTNKDWGSDDYGTIQYKMWVIDEDKAKQAYDLLNEYLQDPEHTRYTVKEETPPEKPTVNLKIVTPKKRSNYLSQPSPITSLLLLLCFFIFAWDSFTSPEFKSASTSISISPIYTSPIKKELLYDYPKAYSIIADMISKFGVDAVQDTRSLPPEGQVLLQEYEQTPYWQGFYDDVLAFFHPHNKKIAPWFEKIKQGELWRLITPVFLHADLFHLLFNMIWLYILGKQLELHLGTLRYISFILIAAIITNTAQYLMSGPNFMGISGVMCAFLTFIWRRQVDAPWEGYQLQRMTFLFIMLFIIGMFALQVFAFVLEVLADTTVNTSIANTAHLVGAITGLIFSRIPFFANDRWVHKS